MTRQAHGVRLPPMPDRIFRLYQRKRIVNVNANVTAAALLSIVIGAYPVHLVTAWVGAERELVNSLIAGAIDLSIDVMIYFGLHWIANHWRPLSPKTEADHHDYNKEKRPFWKDATLVQFERALLSPLYYVVAVGSMWGLQVLGMHHVWAYVIGFAAAIFVTRILHTLWGLRSGTLRDD